MKNRTQTPIVFRSSFWIDFLSIFEKSGNQDRGKNPIKIDENSFQNLVFFFDRRLDKFWEGFGS